MRGSSNVKITRNSSRNFAMHFLVNHQEFDGLFTFNGSGKRPLTLILSLEYRGEGTYFSPLSDIESHH